jgi:integrase
MDRVSALLGHSSIKVTEKHYSPWVRARQEQLEAEVRRSWQVSLDRVLVKRVPDTVSPRESRFQLDETGDSRGVRVAVKSGQAGADTRSLVSAICRRLAQAVAFCRLEGRLQDFRGESSAGRAFGRSQTLKDNVCASPRVSILLGHSSIKVTEKHYSPWVRARQEQLEADVRRTWESSVSTCATRPIM